MPEANFSASSKLSAVHYAYLNNTKRITHLMLFEFHTFCRSIYSYIIRSWSFSDIGRQQVKVSGMPISGPSTFPIFPPSALTKGISIHNMRFKYAPHPPIQSKPFPIFRYTVFRLAHFVYGT